MTKPGKFSIKKRTGCYCPNDNRVKFCYDFCFTDKDDRRIWEVWHVILN